MSDKTIKRSENIENMSKAVVCCLQMLDPFISIIFCTFWKF